MKFQELRVGDQFAKPADIDARYTKADDVTAHVTGGDPHEALAFEPDEEVVRYVTGKVGR